MHLQSSGQRTQFDMVFCIYERDPSSNQIHHYISRIREIGEKRRRAQNRALVRANEIHIYRVKATLVKV